MKDLLRQVLVEKKQQQQQQQRQQRQQQFHFQGNGGEEHVGHVALQREEVATVRRDHEHSSKDEHSRKDELPQLQEPGQ